MSRKIRRLRELSSFKHSASIKRIHDRSEFRAWQDICLSYICLWYKRLFLYPVAKCLLDKSLLWPLLAKSFACSFLCLWGICLWLSFACETFVCGCPYYFKSKSNTDFTFTFYRLLKLNLRELINKICMGEDGNFSRGSGNLFTYYKWGWQGASALEFLVCKFTITLN